MKKFNKKLFTILYWTLSLTWGALMTIPGLLITLLLILCGKKVHKNGCSYIVEVGGNWGGLELGCVALCGNYSESSPEFYEHIRRHEFGHGVQELLFGPFQLILVWIPSAVRYWYRELKYYKKGIQPPTKYDDIWFEGTATKLGSYFIDKLENN